MSESSDIVVRRSSVKIGLCKAFLLVLQPVRDWLDGRVFELAKCSLDTAAGIDEAIEKAKVVASVGSYVVENEESIKERITNTIDSEVERRVHDFSFAMNRDLDYYETLVDELYEAYSTGDNRRMRKLFAKHGKPVLILYEVW